jgi:hypothetical protein
VDVCSGIVRKRIVQAKPEKRVSESSCLADVGPVDPEKGVRFDSPTLVFENKDGGGILRSPAGHSQDAIGEQIDPIDVTVVELDVRVLRHCFTTAGKGGRSRLQTFSSAGAGEKAAGRAYKHSAPLELGERRRVALQTFSSPELVGESETHRNCKWLLQAGAIGNILGKGGEHRLAVLAD